ncbi:helicase/SNF2 family domain protein [Psychromonas marina]|uniref:Helicase/SNF2 family domain protein n=1 Tax=Psychromonas marina TaxID=88364 RepID=A0ABQ6E075_9GAMM|nr:DEAD/DEAH box helicase [Psychromonas marina]GLS90638.1 helicase/SNF2 family domain protein [Psychromonas marina]
MPKITQQDISTSFGRNIIDRGTLYFKESRVLSCDFDEQQNKLSGSIKGSSDTPYQTSAMIKPSNKGGFIIHSTCSCRVGWNCKHAVALLLAYQADTPNYNIENSYQTWYEMLQGQLDKKQPKPVVSAYEGYFRLSFIKTAYNHALQYIQVEYGSVRFLKSENVSVFAEKDLISVVDNETWMESYKWVKPEDVNILQLLLAKEGRVAKLAKTTIHTQHDLLALQQILATGRCFWREMALPIVASEAKALQLQWHDDADLKQLEVSLLESENWLLVPTPTPYYIDTDTGAVGEITSEFDRDWILSLIQTPPLADEQCKHFTEQVSLRFPQAVLPNPIAYQTSELNAPLRVEFSLTSKVVKGNPLFISRLSFFYGDLRLDPVVLEELTRNQFMFNNEIVTIKRDIEAETFALNEYDQLCLLDLLTYDDKQPKSTQQLGILPPELGGSQQFQWLSFLTAHKARLEVIGWEFNIASDLVLESEQIDSIDIAISEQGNWFDLGVSIEVEGKRIELLPLLLEWLRSNEDWQQNSFDILLAQANGRPLRVKRSSIQPILSILQELGEVNNDNIKLPQSQAALLAQLPEINKWVGGDHVKSIADKLTNFTGIETVEVPSELKATLRDYQLAGLNWLVFMNEYGFSGVLADDMGLGKTIQALAYLLYKKQHQQLTQPAIVICPTSLVGNWMNEAAKFTPDLKVLVLHGADRHQYFETILNYDLVITTYPLVGRDFSQLEPLQFSDLILDEAQTIKNPLAKMTKSIKQLNAKQRLCLTGTPMENHLGELWSLFDFLMPGFLGTHTTFNRFYRKGIEGEGNQQIQDWLIQKTQPFLMRRTKDEVAKELPAKTEIVHKVVLPNDQRTLYESIRITMEAKVRDLLKEKGMARSRIEFLDALLKLRQACCDPRLVKLEHAQGIKSSAKLDFLMEIVPEMIEEGRRILIFSQFATMLGLIGDELESKGINYVKLTGQTRNRTEIIDKFQGGEVPIFLISLKAGGVGLNLTAADTVIHYDPWWNPAVENQATDRAYRIGQDKPVFVYKLICEQTVEERVLALQARKQQLADSVYGKEQEDKFAPDSSDALLKLFERY